MDGADHDFSCNEDRSGDTEGVAVRLRELISENHDLRAELDAVRRAAINDKIVMIEYVNDVRLEISALNHLQVACKDLIREGEQMISDMQRESADLAKIIDMVQASRFWKIKRLAGRLRSFIRRT